ASTFHGPALCLQAISYLLDGAVDAADPIFAHAAEVCLRTGDMPTQRLALSEGAVVAIERHDWRAARAFADRAVTIMQTGQCEDYLTSTLIHAVAARTAAHQ